MNAPTEGAKHTEVQHRGEEVLLTLILVLDQTSLDPDWSVEQRAFSSTTDQDLVVEDQGHIFRTTMDGTCPAAGRPHCNSPTEAQLPKNTRPDIMTSPD